MSSARLCVTVTAPTMGELRERRDQVADADLVELRVDTVRDPSATGALAGRQRPVVFTCRPTWEGGFFTGSEEERHRLLSDARALGAEYVDVEWKSGFTDLIQDRGGKGVVLSTHDFEGIPSDMATRAAAMRATGAEVVKVAAMAHRLMDCVELTRLVNPIAGSTVVIAMGDSGLASRILATRFGSAWTYAGDGVAPGQLSATRLRDEFSFHRVNDRTQIFGVVGRPVMHSVSPAMHNAAFRDSRIDAVYLPLAARDFDDFLSFAGAIDLQGASVTAPFKLDAFASAIEVDDIGRRTQAVNTLRREPNGWAACNTDVPGFMAPLEATLDVRGRRATILGAGGAARATTDALITAGAHVSISARQGERAAVLARTAQVAVGEWPPVAGSWDILVNTTPVGTTPAVDESPLPDGPFTGELVYDLVYNPPETRLLRDARAAGCRTLGGLDMLVAQARRQFEWWTGVTPSARVMREAAIAALAQGAAPWNLGTLELWNPKNETHIV